MFFLCISQSVPILVCRDATESGSEATGRENMSVLLISSFKCKGLADKKKSGYVFTWLADQKYDIFCLQETHSSQLDKVEWKKDRRG